MKRSVLILAPPLLLTGCYHAVIETGRQPSGQTIERPWASGFIAGLIGPDAVNTASQCPNGVARVETYHSIPNVLAQMITGSLYSPMTIEVHCAAAGGVGAADIVDSPDELEVAVESGEPFLMKVPTR